MNSFSKLFPTCLLSAALFAAMPVNAQDAESEKMDLQEATALCQQWAEEDGIESGARAQYVEECLADMLNEDAEPEQEQAEISAQ